LSKLNYFDPAGGKLLSLVLKGGMSYAQASGGMGQWPMTAGFTYSGT
jgi:hypothetical protein